jgi:cyclopropane fatty-acyl-phospholipid synthase-like methyltransferase
MDTMLQFRKSVPSVSGDIVLEATGKTVLRPGGQKATTQLLRWARFQPNETVLELRSGIGTRAIAIAKQYGVRVIGFERSPRNVAIAQERIRKAGLARQIQIYPGALDQEETLGQAFDYVLAETMLTLQSDAEKRETLRHIYQVLKPGGFLLSHELMLHRLLKEEIQQVFLDVSYVNVLPLSRTEWLNTYLSAGLELAHCMTGEVAMLSPGQLLWDEGWIRAGQVYWRLLTRRTLRDRMTAICRIFHEYSAVFGYLAVCAQRSK